MGFADKVLVNFTNCASSTQLFVEFAPYSCQIHHPNGNRSPSPPPSQAAPYTACIFAGIFFWSSLSYTLHLTPYTFHPLPSLIPLPPRPRKLLPRSFPRRGIFPFRRTALHDLLTFVHPEVISIFPEHTSQALNR